MGSNPAEGRTKIQKMSAKNITFNIVALNVQTCIQQYLIEPSILWDPVGVGTLYGYYLFETIIYIQNKVPLPDVYFGYPV